MSKLVDAQPAPRSSGPARKATKGSAKPKSKQAGGPGAKQVVLIRMLQAKRGANIDAIVKATGWLPHTGRAMISGLRKKSHDIKVDRAAGKKATYRIVASPKKSSRA